MRSHVKAPSLLAISIAWSVVIACIMTAITFLHQTPGEVAAAEGGLQWGQVGFLFLIWFIAAELTLVIGGALYFGVALLLRRRPRG
jgi:CBS-domain-containing membrane protein